MKKLVLVLAVVFCVMGVIVSSHLCVIGAEEVQATEESQEKSSIAEELQALDELWPEEEPQLTEQAESVVEPQVAEEVQAVEETQPVEESAVTEISQPAEAPEIEQGPAVVEVPPVAEELEVTEEPIAAEETQPEVTLEDEDTAEAIEAEAPVPVVEEPAAPKVVSAQKIRMYMDKAKLYRAQGKNDKAVTSLTRVIEADPAQETLAEAYFLRGLIYKQMDKNEKMQADWQEAQALGKSLEEGRIVRGKKQGLHTLYSTEGDMLSRATYKNDQLNGKCLKFYSNGQTSHKGFYKNGKLSGLFIWYAPNGEISEKGTFKKGKRDGVFYRYHENGKLSQRVFYRKGVKTGTAYLYDENGRLKRKVSL